MRKCTQQVVFTQFQRKSTTNVIAYIIQYNTMEDLIFSAHLKRLKEFKESNACKSRHSFMSSYDYVETKEDMEEEMQQMRDPNLPDWFHEQAKEAFLQTA